MENIKNFRQKLGLTQELMADILGCNLGQYVMAEHGERKLPANTLQAQTKLNLVISNTLNQEIPITETVGINIVKFAQKALRQLAAQLNAQEIVLETLTQKQERLNLRLLFITQIMLASFLDSDSIPALGLQILGRKARRQLEELELKIFKQQFAISTTQTQISLLQKV
jgi:transcriptional regulator with XRE-family HTH domain